MKASAAQSRGPRCRTLIISRGEAATTRTTDRGRFRKGYKRQRLGPFWLAAIGRRERRLPHIDRRSSLAVVRLAALGRELLLT
jgi:hypothetical protein